MDYIPEFLERLNKVYRLLLEKARETKAPQQESALSQEAGVGPSPPVDAAVPQSSNAPEEKGLREKARQLALAGGVAPDRVDQLVERYIEAIYFSN